MTPVTSRLNVLESRHAQLSAREQQLLDALTEVRAGLAQTRRDLEVVHRAAERAGANPGTKSDAVPTETWRRTVRSMGTFTVSELAARLDVTKQTAKRHLDAMLCTVPPMVRPAGRALGKPVFEYVPPDDPGDAFRAQQRLGKVHELFPAPTMAPDRGGDVRQSRIESIASKEVRAVVREAIDAGWSLERGTGKHPFRLVRGTKRVTVVGSPRNPSNAANNLRQQVFGFNARLRAGVR